MEKIIKSHSQRFSNVLSKDKLQILSDIDLYKAEVERECAGLREETKRYCEEQKKILDEKARLELESLSHELYSYNQKQLELLLKRFDSELFATIYHILSKLGVTNINHSQISNLLTLEISKYIENQDFTIRCNHRVEDSLKQHLSGVQVPVTYKSDDKLDDSQCVIETNLCLIYVDIDKLQAEINTILGIQNYPEVDIS